MKIVLKDILNNEGHITIQFSYDEALHKFFNENNMEYEYIYNEKRAMLDGVPDSILVIPWLCNILPIAWLTDSEIIVDKLDKDFYMSIPEFKQGYIDMYPDCAFKGKVTVKELQDNFRIVGDRSAMFFSSGADAYCTLVRHLEEKPDLITLWGADIPYDNVNGWNVLKKSISESAEMLDLPLIIAHSSFRRMLNEHNLTMAFHRVMHDGWWHGAQHGIGLIGHAAPINYKRKVSRQYIAASYWPGAKLTCASWPTIDNHVRFFNCSVFHDAFIPRQDKIKIIVNAHKQRHIPIKMHVCWKNVTGHNCCLCEKCCRTIMAIYSECDDPTEYGFDIDNELVEKEIYLCKNGFEYDFISIPMWNQIKERVIENMDSIKKAGFYDKVNWIVDYDFDNSGKTIKMRIKKLCKRISDKICNTFSHFVGQRY